MTPNTTPNTPEPETLAALEAKVAQLTNPALVRALDGALVAPAARAGLADEAALLADLRLSAILDLALASEQAPAGLADRILAGAPLHEEAQVAGKLVSKPAVQGKIGKQASKKGEWMRRPWRFAAVASISFSLSLMSVSLIVKQEVEKSSNLQARQKTSALSTDFAKLQATALSSGVADAELKREMNEFDAELELAGF